jgi:hypothetical protein
MDHPIAYQIGFFMGMAVVILVPLGILVFFIVSLVKAISTGRKGWIIAASISGLPMLAITALIMIAFSMGIIKGIHNFQDRNASIMGSPSQLLTASMTPVAGNVLPYQISYPWLDSWKKESFGAFDQLFSYRDAYVGVIAEGIGVGTPQRVCDLSQQNLAAKASVFSATTPVPIEIDSHSWLTYDAMATVSGMNVKYRFYCLFGCQLYISDPDLDRHVPF